MDIRQYLPPGFPTIVTLCGSTKFKEAYIETAKQETLAGRIVISVGMFGHQEGIDMEGEVKQRLDQLHFRKIDVSDGILVVNPHCTLCSKCGALCDSMAKLLYDPKDPIPKSICCVAPVKENGNYIGTSTRNEIAYARAQGKTVRSLQPLPEGI